MRGRRSRYTARSIRQIVHGLLFPTVFGVGPTGCSPDKSPVFDPDSWYLEIQETFGDEEKAPLSHVLSIAVHPDGYVAVADFRPARVHLFRPDGGVQAIGGNGLGPAEYNFVTGVGFHGDTLWVTDAGFLKAIFFDLDGDHLDTERVLTDRPAEVDGAIGPIRLLGDGSWLTSTPTVAITSVMNDRVSNRPFFRVWDEVASTVYVQPLPRTDFFRVKLGDEVNLEGVHSIPSGPIFHSAADGQKHFVVDRPVAVSTDSASFEIHCLDLRGDTLWSRSIGYEPIQLSEEWKQDWVNGWGERMSDPMGIPKARIAAAFREQAYLPDFLPPVADFQTGMDGRIWVREARADTTEVRWLVLDSLGNQEGRLQGPSGFRLLMPTATEAFGVTKNKFDVETVVRAAIVGQGAAGTGKGDSQ